MGQRVTRFGIDEFYHVYNRGVDKREIFLEEKDYQRFALLLFAANCEQPIQISTHKDWRNPDMFNIERGERIVSIGAYCLMPNHFHLLVREIKPNGITQFMQRVSTAYSMYFNKKEERTGALFQGRFKAEHVTNDAYLKYLYSYIHLNPISIIDPKWKESGIQDIAEVRNFLSKYQYSSYSDYLNKERPEKSILFRDDFPKYFEVDDIVEFVSEIEDWLMLKSSQASI